MIVWHRIQRRVRHWLGRGWAAEEFSRRYSGKSRDAWGYLQNPAHASRADRILFAFDGFRAKRLLELGCAEGFLTRRLLQVACEVVACDLSAEAVERARHYCGDAANCQFVAGDLRNGLPSGDFDACLASDVLYYLSRSEISRLATRLHQQMPRPRRLVLANEWNVGYRDLTSPHDALTCLTANASWQCLQADELDLGGGKSHFLAILE